MHIAPKEDLLSDIKLAQDWRTASTFPSNKITGANVLWMQSTLSNNSNDDIALSLIAGNAFVDRIDAFLLDEQERILYSIQHNNLHPSPGMNSQGLRLDFDIRKQQQLTLYLRIDDDSASKLPVELWQREQYQQQRSIQFILLGALCGGLSLLATYFFVTFIVTNARAHFWFSIFSVACMTTYISAEGILPSLIGMPWLAAELTALSLMLCIFASIKFSRLILNQVSVIWLRSHYALIMLPLASIFIYEDYWQLAFLLGCIGIFLASKLIATLVYRSALDWRSTSIYFAGWSLLSIVVLLEIRFTIFQYEHLSYAQPLPFVLTCIGVALLGAAVVSREKFDEGSYNRARDQYVHELEKFQAIVNFAIEGIYTADAQGRLSAANPALINILGYKDSEHLLTKNSKLAEIFANPVDADLVQGELSIHKRVINKELKGKRADGSEFWMSLSCQNVLVAGQVRQFGAIFDITEQHFNASSASYLKSHDPLTGLLNKQAILEYISADTHSDAPKYCLWLKIIEFDKIKQCCGYFGGDSYIRQIAQCISDVLPHGTVIGRYQDEQFVIVAPSNNTQEVNEWANKLVNAVAEYRFQWQEQFFQCCASVGICSTDEELATENLVDRLQQAASIAESQQNAYQYYEVNQAQHTELLDINSCIDAIKQGLAQSQFTIFYQHYRATSAAQQADRLCLSLKLLMPNTRLQATSSFMPLAETHNMAVDIDKWMIEHSFHWLMDNAQHKFETVHIGLSQQSIRSPEFMFYLLNAFSRYHIPYSMLCFDLTESIAFTQTHYCETFMQQLKSVGCQFALTGFSGHFSHNAKLKKLHFDYLILDENYLDESTASALEQAYIKATKDICGAIDSQCIARFVNTDELMVQLGKLGVDYVQGFYIAEPEPLASFIPYNALAK